MQDIYTYAMLVSIVSFAGATFFSPGPNNLMLLSSGLTFGYRRTLPHILGIVIGFPLMVIAVGLGVSTVFELFPQVDMVLKVVGISYLLWMAWQIANKEGNISSGNAKDKPFTLIQGALFQWVNPKAWIIAITATTSFTTQGEMLMVQIFIIAFIYFFVGVLSTNTWALGGLFLQRFISNPKSVRIFNILMAILIVLSVVPFVLGE